MARKDEAAELLIEGYSIPEIAYKMGISTISVKLYLCTVVGEGKIRRSDIFFSVSSNKRKAIEEIVGNSQKYQTWEIQKILKEKGCEISKEELDVFLLIVSFGGSTKLNICQFLSIITLKLMNVV
ncbi:hypothetical protein ES703_92437 [subsurface metagenome]